MLLSPSIPAVTSWPRHSISDYYDAEADRISRRIDEGLKQEAARLKEARQKEVKVLLLGQAESGKSTLQKQFQLYYASQTLDRERPRWTAVVYLNIIRAVSNILDGLDQVLSQAVIDHSDLDTPITDDVREEMGLMQTALQLVLDAEPALSSELNGGLLGRASAFARAGWQSVVNSRPVSTDVVKTLATIHAADILCEKKGCMKVLWHHPLVVSLWSRRKLRIEESAPFFLDNLDRICVPEYMPTTEDILHVRMQTLGVTEHSLSIHQGGIDYTWRMYDVTGARGQRHSWIPFFDEATAILFLAPISAFDQQLDEDTKTNRIEDSLQLFTQICSSSLLKKASLILLLNKTDLLRQKLQNGRKVRKYIPSFGNRPNTYQVVSEYFRTHFCQVHRRNDTMHRALFVHFTSMIDTSATRLVIDDMGDSIIRKHILEAGLA